MTRKKYGQFLILKWNLLNFSEMIFFFVMNILAKIQLKLQELVKMDFWRSLSHLHFIYIIFIYLFFSFQNPKNEQPQIQKKITHITRFFMWNFSTSDCGSSRRCRKGALKNYRIKPLETKLGGIPINLCLPQFLSRLWVGTKQDICEHFHTSIENQMWNTQRRHSSLGQIRQRLIFYSLHKFLFWPCHSRDFFVWSEWHGAPQNASNFKKQQQPNKETPNTRNLHSHRCSAQLSSPTCPDLYPTIHTAENVNQTLLWCGCWGWNKWLVCTNVHLCKPIICLFKGLVGGRNKITSHK